MAGSSAGWDPTFTEEEEERRPERKRKRGDASPEAAKWRTEAEQKIYSSKLLEALRRVRRSSAPTGGALPRSRAVREAADRVLAAAARGRTRWSRAILSNRTVKLRTRRCRLRRRPEVPSPSSVAAAASSARATERRKTPALEKKAKVLGRLVPGCGKLSFPTLLDETSDYIAALQMQVRALTAIAEVLASGTAVTAGAPPPEPM